MKLRILACVALLAHLSSLVGMDGPMIFPFKVFIENKSKSPITLINCWGDYSVCAELDSKVIDVNATMGIERGEGKSGIFKLVIAGVKHRIINIPDIVESNLLAPHDPHETKSHYNGYRVKVDDYPPTQEFTPVVQNQNMHLTVDENNVMRFVAVPDKEKLSALLALKN